VAHARRLGEETLERCLCKLYCFEVTLGSDNHGILLSLVLGFQSGLCTFGKAQPPRTMGTSSRSCWDPRRPKSRALGKARSGSLL
jgi:hypothetical protein